MAYELSCKLTVLWFYAIQLLDLEALNEFPVKNSDTVDMAGILLGFK